MMPPDSPAGGRRPDLISAEVSEQIRSLISYAEEVANAVRAEGEQRAEARLREADQEAGRRLEDARREAEARGDPRRRLISELSDRIVERGQSLLLQLEQTDSLRRRFEDVMRTFGDVAHKLAAEAAPQPPAPQLPAGPQPSAAPQPQSLAQPEPPEQPQAPPPQSLGEPPRERTAAPASGPDRGPNGADADGEPGEGGRLSDEDGAHLIALQMAIAGSTRGEAAAHLQRTFQTSDLHRILDEVFEDGERRT